MGDETDRLDETARLKAFRDKFRVAELQVVDTGAWTWSVRPGQPTLGAGIVSLNRYALRLSDVTPAEMAELAGLVSTLEQSIKRAFNHDIMNYLMLMMVDHHVHYHVIPRFAAPREFAGLPWLDNGWPALPALAESQHKNQNGILRSIRDKLVTEAAEREA